MAELVNHVRVEAFEIPTSSPESDGTLEWNKTTLVLVEVSGGGHTGLGFTYADTATARLIHDKLVEAVQGQSAMDVQANWLRMVRAIRNLGRPGVCSMAISAMDFALWDLKARILKMPLARLLGMARPSVPAYGSGGFTSYTVEQLQDQLAEWVKRGLRTVKMKVGREPQHDFNRVRYARSAIGMEIDLFVDANGAYTRKQALQLAERFALYGVRWFEEPVPSDDLEGLRLLRDRGPAGMDIAAGEYGYDVHYFDRMLNAGAVDVLQADATRCGGVTGFMQIAALCSAHSLRLSAHTAPSLHTPLCCAALPAWNIEYFHDHVRIEEMLFEGAAVPVNGMLAPDLSRPGFGLELRRKQAMKFAA